MNKKGFLPAIVGVEIHYFLYGLAAGIILMIVLLLLGKSGVLPFSLCDLMCS